MKTFNPLKVFIAPKESFWTVHTDADARAEYPGKHNCIEHSAIIENGRRVWKAYETLFVDGEDFDQIGAAFEERYDVHHAMMGKTELRLMRQRELVDFAVEWIEKNRKR